MAQCDVNGQGMHDLYRVLKRQSSLFIKRYGMAVHLREHNSKVSNRAGEAPSAGSLSDD